ncbi:hypothetical protein F4679DRAFT_588268 [Xylaria curta]|nr:hypothetical protein F4679DRAFT_588268 [Xylaria curta]
MQTQQSKEPCHEQGPHAAQRDVSQNGNYASPPNTPDKGEEMPQPRRSSCLPPMADSSAVQKATLTPESMPSWLSILDGFKSSQNNDGETPETAIIVDSDDEEDLFTLLRKYRTKNIHKVTRQDNWESLNIAWCEDAGIYGKKTRKTGEHTSRSKNTKHRQLMDVQHRHNARSKLPNQSFRPSKGSNHTAPSATHPPSLSGKNKRKRPYPPNRGDGLDAYQTITHRSAKKCRVARHIASSSSIPNNQTQYSEAGHEKHRFDIHGIQDKYIYVPADKKTGKVSFQVDHSPGFRSNIEPSASKFHRSKGNIVRVNDRREHRVDDQTNKSHTKRSHKAKKSKLVPFRQSNRSFEVHPDNKSEPDTLEEPQEGRYISARVDSGELLKDTRPLTTYESKEHRPQTDKSLVTKRSDNIEQRFRCPQAVNHPKLDGALPKYKPSSLRTRSEERNAALIQKFERQQRAREYVVPELKWRYTIKCVESADIILDDEDLKEKTRIKRSFADRQQANKFLDNLISSAKVDGGLDAIAKRTSTMEGPELLLKVDVMFANGEHYLLWVERDLVVLKNLTKEIRDQVQWQPTPRPKILHYVVECDLLTLETSLLAPCENDEDVAMDSNDRYGGLGSYGKNIGVTIEKVERKSFSIREMANDYAAKLFLENTRVHKQFATLSDVLWWRENALPEHKKAMSNTREPGGLYELKMNAHDMNDRLGWDQITVHVYEVDDITGPANF